MAMRQATSADEDAIFDLVNEAYQIESEGGGPYKIKSFKSCDRWLSKSELQLADGGREAIVIPQQAAEQNTPPTGSVLDAVIIYSIDLETKVAHFGPLAVSRNAQSRGLGRKLVDEVRVCPSHT